MSDFTSPWQGYDFSGLSAALSRIQEITRPALEALQNIQSTLQPIVEALEQYKPKVAEIGQALLQASRRFSAIRKMGDAQFVFWDYMTEEYVDAIVDSENINKTLREQMIRERFSKVYRTIDKTLSSAVMHKHKRLYSQSVKAFRNGGNDLLISLGYSFGDEHINRIILNALSVYDFRLVIFGDSDMIRKLQEIGDNRIWIINSEDNIHYFNNFVERVLPTQDEEQREEIEIKKSLKKLAVVLGDSSEDPK